MTENLSPTPPLPTLIATYWKAVNDHDWDLFDTTLADDVVYDLPQTRERIRGKEAYSRFNREYPGAWQTRVLRTVVESPQAATWTHTTSGLTELHAQTFFTTDPRTGLITEITEFWPEPYEPPTGREHLVERY
ncbi:polyketide cyclase [Streptomyces spiroverticillatus]|uniref:Polyketide cyclase n=1 Tax=Streptomyces finlayi TaxID=67296 RepID=A0A918X4M9_9ACTN|nr:nuclear transport factor 2 family protein [Streptomyces finlayi]GHA33940.1 polyketide cyclase [Streptomyces spiroverticillatus]GHD11557.1 polyketide cyclase [Streptomyces finlayi]